VTKRDVAESIFLSLVPHEIEGVDLLDPETLEEVVVAAKIARKAAEIFEQEWESDSPIAWKPAPTSPLAEKPAPTRPTRPRPGTGRPGTP
jgi:hypothetical protein